jgi:hypothetical protein
MSRWLHHILVELQKDIAKKTTLLTLYPDESVVSGNHKKVIISTSESHDIIIERPTKTAKFAITQTGVSGYGRTVAKAIRDKLNEKVRRFTNTTNSNSNSSNSSNSRHVLHIGRKTRRSIV